MTPKRPTKPMPRGSQKLLSAGYKLNADDLLALGNAAKQLGTIWHVIRQEQDGSLSLWRDGHGFLDTQEDA